MFIFPTDVRLSGTLPRGALRGTVRWGARQSRRVLLDRLHLGGMEYLFHFVCLWLWRPGDWSGVFNLFCELMHGQVFVQFSSFSAEPDFRFSLPCCPALGLACFRFCLASLMVLQFPIQFGILSVFSGFFCPWDTHVTHDGVLGVI